LAASSSRFVWSTPLEANPGDYVLVHVGFALGKVDEEEAERTYKLLAEMDQLSELEIPET
jgi:hydrogenase assembly chaperone HypC/HupF